MLVKAGSYIGSGVDGKAVTGIGFQPDLVIIKRSNTGDSAFFRTASMASGNSMTLRNDSGIVTGGIKTLDYDGFTLGTNAEVNNSAVTYYYLAVKKDAAADFDYGTYTGNGTDSRSITLQSSFPFTWLAIKGDGGRTGAYKNKDLLGDKTHAFYSTGTNTDQIQATMSTSTGTVELGTSDFVNTNARIYYWFGFKEVAGLATSFTYTGDGTDNRDITIPGTSFQPGFVWIKQEDANDPRLRTSAHTGDSSQSFDGATETNSIQGFNATGFQVGSNSQVNGSTKTYHVLALKDNAPTALALQVAASSDDARNLASLGTGSTTVATQHLGKFDTTNIYVSGFRFTSVAIPQGATILSAILDLYSSGTAIGTSPLVKFYGNAIDNATAFNISTEKPESKTKTTASVSKTFTSSAWNPTTGFGVDPVDIAGVVQEIVSRAGWASGNALAVLAYDNGSANSTYVGVSTYDSASSRGAKLTIAYTVAGSTANPGAVSSALAVLAPIVTGAAIATAAVLSGALGIQAPSARASAQVSPAVISQTAAVQNPVIRGAAQISPPNLTTALAVQTTTVSGGNINIPVGAVGSSLSVLSPSESGGASTSPTVQNLAISVQNPGAKGAGSVSAVINNASLAVLSPVVSGGAVVSPGIQNITGGVQSSATAGAASISPAALSAFLSIPSPVATGSAQISPSGIIGTLAIQPVTARGAANIAPAAQNANFAVAAPLVAVSANANPLPVTGMLAILSPRIEAGEEFNVSTLPVSLSVPGVSASGQAKASINTVSGALVILPSAIRIDVFTYPVQFTAQLAVLPVNVTTGERFYPYSKRPAPYSGQVNHYAKQANPYKKLNPRP